MSRPLVSIMTRTLNRACLADAAACVAAQTYRPLEWVVVDAAGRGEVRVDAGQGVTTRIVGNGAPLRRSAAGNFGFANCSGRYINILDDDDLLKPAHVNRLAQTLARTPDALAAFADSEVWHAPGAPSRFFLFGYSHLLLARRNIFPPNAVLFDAALTLTHGVQFDEGLEYFEDWDFWLQCARHTRFVRVTGPTAIYRVYLSQSGINVDPGAADPRLYLDRELVRKRYETDRRREEDAFDVQKRKAQDATQRGDLQAASVLWKEVFLLYPYDVEAINHFSECCNAQGNINAAIDVLRLGAGLNPAEATIWWNLAMLLDSKGDTGPATEARHRAIQLDPALGNRAPLEALNPPWQERRAPPQGRS